MEAIGSDSKIGITVWRDNDLVPLTLKLSLLFDTLCIASLPIFSGADQPIVVVYPRQFGPAGDGEKVRTQITQRSDALGTMSLSRVLRLRDSHESLEGLYEDARSIGLGEVSHKMDLDALFAMVPDQLNDPATFALSLVASGRMSKDRMFCGSSPAGVPLSGASAAASSCTSN
jgi:hypothetical protein